VYGTAFAFETRLRTVCVQTARIVATVAMLFMNSEAEGPCFAIGTVFEASAIEYRGSVPMYRSGGPHEACIQPRNYHRATKTNSSIGVERRAGYADEWSFLRGNRWTLERRLERTAQGMQRLTRSWLANARKRDVATLASSQLPYAGELVTIRSAFCSRQATDSRTGP